MQRRAFLTLAAIAAPFAMAYRLSKGPALRTTLVRRGTDWVPVRMSELRPGDEFRLVGDDLCPKETWRAEGMPYRSTKDGVWGVWAHLASDTLAV